MQWTKKLKKNFNEFKSPLGYTIGYTKYLFVFGKCFKKKTTEYFLKFLFLFESTTHPEIMENNFIQMAALVGHAVAYTIGSIFKHIIDCVQLYFRNGFTNIVL